MKAQKVIAILFISILCLGCGSGSETVDESQLVEREGITYKVNSEKPFTGTSESWYENGQKRRQATYKNGKLGGVAKSWYENGQNRDETHIKDGKRDGITTRWDKNGQAESHTYKNGVMVK